MSVQALKTDMRKKAEAARAALSAEERAGLSARACAAAVSLLEEHGPAEGDGKPMLFAYIPFRTELDVSPLIEWCWSRGGSVVVPKVIRDRKLMSLHLIRGFDDLEAGAWGIREPNMSCPVLERPSAIDVMLVPGLAYDAEGGRLGYGGGYYDAFIRRSRENGGREPFKLALAFDVQLVGKVPMDDHDFRIDALVTESRSFIFRTKRLP